MKKKSPSTCNRDCFNCPFDDCICDDMDAEDWRNAREIDDFVRPKTAAERSIAAKQREYREANREKYNAYMREYMRAYSARRRQEATE